MVYKGSNETYDFRKFKTICAFGNEIRNNITNMNMANDEQDQFRRINEFKSKTRLQNSESKKVKEDVLIVQEHFLKVDKWYLKHSKVGYF